MEPQKRVAAIHDISGFGRCSLTVALPIISAAGVETAILPTAALSTHTGGLEGYTYRDLTEDIGPFMRHWKSLGLKFDAIYTGFLGSSEQVGLVLEFFGLFKTVGNIAVVDPVMADNGVMYSVFDRSFAAEMRRLCEKADIIVPNFTEAAFLLDEEYHEGPYTKEYTEKMLKNLASLGAGKVVLTGVYFDGEKLGAACYDSVSGGIYYAMAEKIDGFYHGTGDVFGSALTGALMNGKTLEKAADIAVNFTQKSIARTKKAGTDTRFGVNFEKGLGDYIKLVNNE
ncbi:MAG: pyridoxamine kinase [Oscillospiraceae bacterium]|nr:pyridoxamine kinase [Oscillospiraceae bacterium]